ncbi:MAG: aminotransferase class I/II-fold pyridoxal phosphate-dependent enzyme [Bdellovibrionales bacterium]|nr:aminotransferase class I/II-fold pyridoxal phosphate-dependent enzyme [Bdellovibrionales bacterium]
MKNSELDLAHFLRSREKLATVVDHFSDYLNRSQESEMSPYLREVVSEPGPRVLVKRTPNSEPQEMIMMGSNDYLGFSNNEEIKKFICQMVMEKGVGVGGPPLLNGMTSLHRELERALADNKSQEDALLYSSGYQANMGWVTCLVRSGDVVVYDELNHASLFDGMKSFKKGTATFRSFKHNSVESLEEVLQKVEMKDRSTLFVVVEGVYSMDGDICPLDRIIDVAKQHGAFVVLDDAHGTGVLGTTGAGTAEFFSRESDIDLYMGTFSKALSMTGGFLAGPRKIIDYLRFFSRSYMFSAHLPIPTVAGVLKGLEIIKNQPSLRERLHENVRYFVAKMNEAGYRVSSLTPIVPVLIPNHISIREFNRRLASRGLFVNGIEYPAVKQQRIRVSLMAKHSRADLDHAVLLFKQIGEEMGVLSQPVSKVYETVAEV